MADDPWLDLLSECSFVLGLLERHGARALARVAEGQRLEWDAYPASSMPESSIARGRVSDPTARAVIRHAGGKDAEGEGQDRDEETTADEWKGRHDPIGTAVARMQSELHDACNRIATAQEAAFAAQGLSGGEIFGICQPARDQSCSESWDAHLAKAKKGLQALIGHREDLEIGPRRYLTDEQKAGLRRLEHELIDARNRLRTAEGAMRDATPEVIPEKSREVCSSCGTPKDIATWWGQKPRQWIASESKCRECAERPKRVAKGRAS